MNDQQRAAMQMALTTLEELKKNCTIWLESDDAAITTLREALAQPQGEWVDLMDDEVEEAIEAWWKKDLSMKYAELARAVIAKFKEKNTPPVVPQGEPVAWMYDDGTSHKFIEPVLSVKRKDFPDGWRESPLYAAPVDAKAIRAEDYIKAYQQGRKDMKEEAAKVCEEINMYTQHQSKEAYSCAYACAAAIRSMK